MQTLTRALVRPPGQTFANGLTTAALGAPDLDKALRQHRDYCDALQQCGVEVEGLAPSERYPDSTFVEDVAVIHDGRALLTRPGAPSRAGEVELIRAEIAARFSDLTEVAAPGSLDGGDVCDAGDRWFVGISARTNASGAEQLERWLAAAGRTLERVDIRELPGVLHLKSAIAYVDDGMLVATRALRGRLRGVGVIDVDDDEAYAADCLRINDRVLVPAGYPRIAQRLEAHGLGILMLDMSEFAKMDGGLSCLSLRY
ncbi:MAG TPA: amidinotransferase [Trinickia sp.]|nr:amidinotransferase [Trinickia sp.]